MSADNLSSTGEYSAQVSGGVLSEITEFLANEAAAMDDRDYARWLTYVDERFVYRVPVPRTPDNAFAPHYDERSMLIDESRWSLEGQWFRRMDPQFLELSWAENPPVRFRHFVSNIRPRALKQAGAFEVRSNVMLVGTRQSDAPKYLTGERTDHLLKAPQGWQLLSRWVVLDQSVIDFPQLRVML